MPNPSSTAKDHPIEYLVGSAAAAIVNFPLWRASAFAQSGFSINKTASSTAAASIVSSSRAASAALSSPYVHAFFPPYKGMVGVVAGMTWARAAIFWGSDYGRSYMKQHGYHESTATIVPPLVCSTLVQIINQPIVRASISLQDPTSTIPNTIASIQHIYTNHGLKGLWHGTSAGIAKTIPKYCTAIAVKDWMEDHLHKPDGDPSTSPTYRRDMLCRSAIKSATAGVLGAALTNPLDVIRNEMFKTNMSLIETVRHLHATTGYGFLKRGMSKNLVAVAIPVGCTIFFTDTLIQYSKK
jgi:Mitochondrial carrier protein